jgi:hypothetical protein
MALMRGCLMNATSEKDEKVKIDDVIQFRRTGSVPHPSVNTSTDD